MEFDELSHRVIGCAIEVHRALVPGLLESAYEQGLAQDNARLQLKHPQPVDYKDIHLHCLILGLKSVDKLTAIHEAQS